MKKILYIILAVCTISLVSCNKDFLETSPTTAVSGDTMLGTTDGGYQALNGVIRFFWQWGATTTGYYHQSFGPQSYALMGDLMGEDMVMAASGSGWFWFDYCYNVKARYTSGAWRSYDCWNYYYTVISQVNYIIATEKTMKGSAADVEYIMGNAYALRAYSYLYLAMTFARSYIGHEGRLCVPIYTEPTAAGTSGKARATNTEVFAQAMSDIDKAITLLKGKSQQHQSHIGEAVAYGIKARIALYMGKYDTALEAAKAGLASASAAGKSCAFDSAEHFNDSEAKDVIWGAEVITDQGTTNPQFLAHMDWRWGGYGASARKCCSAELYEKIGAEDLRKAWWNYELLADGKTYGYQQYKFLFGDLSNVIGNGADHIFMRMPELELIAAECECRNGNESGARAYIEALMESRYSTPEDFDAYKSYLAGKSGNTLGALTTDYTGSLLEEILLQRRIELWGEYGRVYDIKRLRQGFQRTAAMGHPAAGLLTSLKTTDPESFDWVLTIPSAETDANKLMVQNPLGSEATATTGDDPALTPKE